MTSLNEKLRDQTMYIEWYISGKYRLLANILKINRQQMVASVGYIDNKKIKRYYYYF